MTVPVHRMIPALILKMANPGASRETAAIAPHNGNRLLDVHASHRGAS